MIAKKNQVVNLKSKSTLSFCFCVYIFWAISEKKTGGVEDTEFPGVSNK